MSNSTINPTIVLVPGSFSVYGAYDPLLVLIRALGFIALAIQLPSTMKRMPLPPATLQDDAAQVRGVVEGLLEEGGEVVVVAQSYGGTVVTEALAGLSVKRLVFVSAMAPRVGETQETAMRMDEGFLPEEVGGYFHLDPVIMAPFVCNDLPYAQAYECAVQLPHHSAASFQSKVTQTSYKDIPLTYVFCEKDLVVSPDRQQRFIDTIEEISGREVDVRRIDSGHCPNWSRPEEFVGMIVEAAGM